MINKLPNWLDAKGHASDIVISSRVRLARNIDNLLFPHCMNVDEKDKLIDSIGETIASSSFKKEVGDMKLLKLDELSGLDREFLLEKHLISPNMLDNYHNRAIVLGLDESISILINEEDHFRIQSFFSGLNLEDAFVIADKVDDALEKFYSYAYHEKYGYLTSCPTNIGTGVRFSVMMHLPALSMTGGLKDIQRSLKSEGFVIRGFFGEGSEGYGSLYQISNQFTIGVKEQEIMLGLEKRINDIIVKEKESRERLFKQKPFEMQDMIYRAFGNLKYSVLLTTKEGMNNVSLIRLGVERGLSFDEVINYKQLNSLIVLSHPAGLQSYFGKSMSPEERERKRTRLFKEILKIGG
ncbi:MAG: protein arginine kinase [Firmicutes bacterium]|nr:protein arginine kinase [Bacillota bacterium]